MIWIIKYSPIIFQVNIDGKTKEEIFSRMLHADEGTFIPGQEQIYRLMKADSFPRFISSLNWLLFHTAFDIFTVLRKSSNFIELRQTSTRTFEITRLAVWRQFRSEFCETSKLLGMAVAQNADSRKLWCLRLVTLIDRSRVNVFALLKY